VSTSNVTQKGQVTIPAEIRKALGLKTGSKVRFRRRGRKVTLEAMEEPAIDSLFGIYKAPKNRAIGDVDRALDDLRLARAKNRDRSKPGR
jgi:AbrB family looped-hinge helix DNA binding protein